MQAKAPIDGRFRKTENGTGPKPMKPMKKHTIKQAGTLRSLLLLFGLALGSGLSAQDAAAVLDAVRRQHAPDRRVAVFEIEAERINDTLHILSLIHI